MLEIEWCYLAVAYFFIKVNLELWQHFLDDDFFTYIKKEQQISGCCCFFKSDKVLFFNLIKNFENLLTYLYYRWIEHTISKVVCHSFNADQLIFSQIFILDGKSWRLDICFYKSCWIIIGLNRKVWLLFLQAVNI